MKKTILLTACACAMLTACSEKRPAVVENPVFDVWNSATIEVSKIEMSDTATVLHIDAYFTPKQWIRIDGGTYIRESGGSQKLIVTRAEGIGLDEEFYMPESGEHSFALYFPPLPPNVTKIDFIESDCEGCFKTWGIYLLPGAKLQTIPPLKQKNTTKPLPEPFISTKKTTLRGQLLGYHKEMGLSVGVNANELFAVDNIPITLKVADDGSFEGELPINRPQITYISAVGPAGWELYTFLVPGEEQEIYVDLRKKSRREARHRPDKEPGDSAYIYTSGRFSPTEMKEVVAMVIVRDWDDYKAFLNTISQMQPQEYRQYLMDGWLQQNLAKIPANLSPNVKHFSELYARFDVLAALLQYEDMQKRAYLAAHNNEMAGYKPTLPPLEYYSFLKDLITDDMMFMAGYKFFVSTLINTDVFLPQGNPSLQERFAYFKEKVTPLLGDGHTLLMDIAYAAMYSERFDKGEVLTDAEKQEITAAVSHKEVAELLITASDQLQKILAPSAADNGSIMHETPQVSNEKLLATILADYRGKVALVDFWATWCGPCLQAHKEIKPLKEELSGKDVVYIYLTGETSPLATWRKMLPDITGNHYRVSDAQWSYWIDAVPVPAIPTYVIYDKNGKETYKTTGFSGVAKIKEEIEKNL